MTPEAEHVLNAYIEAWIAGERPRLETYLQRVEAGERDELAQAIDDFLAIAPVPRYSEATLHTIRAQAFGGAPASVSPMPALVARGRERSGLSLRDLAGRLSRALSLSGGREEKVADYVGQLERGELDTRRLSQR